MSFRQAFFFPVAVSLALAACGGPSTPGQLPDGAFWQAIAPACGDIYEGEMLSDEPTDREWQNAGILLEITECSGDGIDMVFQVGDDRSRSWRLTPVANGIDFRIERAEGTGPGVSGYGGVSSQGPDSLVQVFPIDARTKEMFRQKGLMLALENVWTLEADPEAETLTYEVERIANGRRMRFDLSAPYRREDMTGAG